MVFVTISVKESTKTRLKGFGVYGDNWSDILERLMDNYDNKE